jgi:hypothetical protein
MNKLFSLITVLISFFLSHLGICQTKPAMTYEQYIRKGIPKKSEIDVFLKEISWAKFDSDVGYVLGNYLPHDGIDRSSTISTAQANGARRSFMYAR